MNKKSRAINDIFKALSPEAEETYTAPAETLNDLWNKIIAEPNSKKRQKIIGDFTARHKDAADFFAQNEELINAEAEAALIRAAVGGTHTEREVTYKGGRKTVKSKKIVTEPNTAALWKLLKSRMPEKYSDDPRGEIEIEDVTEVKESVENAEDDSADDEGG